MLLFSSSSCFCGTPLQLTLRYFSARVLIWNCNSMDSTYTTHTGLSNGQWSTTVKLRQPADADNKKGTSYSSLLNQVLIQVSQWLGLCFFDQTLSYIWTTTSKRAGKCFWPGKCEEMVRNAASKWLSRPVQILRWAYFKNIISVLLADYLFGGRMSIHTFNINNLSLRVSHLPEGFLV